MELLLHPRVATAAPSNRLCVWVGAFDVTAAPELSWTLDGNAAQPAALRALQSARPNDALPADPAPENHPRAFTGVYEFTGLEPDTAHVVTVSADGVSTAISLNTLPAEVTSQLDRTFNVLLVSCFHWAEDKGGLAGTIASQLTGTMKPHLTILAGDQVYLDLPTLQNFPDDAIWLANKFEEDYVRNWSDPNAYKNVLGAASSVAIPDDHEYWNNYPNASPLIQNSFSQAGRDRWAGAAQAAFEAFQLAAPNAYGDPIQLEVSPLSFFLADTRSHKDPGRVQTMDENTHQKLDAWVQDVAQRQLFGVFVSGQSLFTKAAGAAGHVTDFELSNYGDYDRVLQTLAKLADNGRPLLCLTGDVHWGRIISATDLVSHRQAMVEVISSPASLVTFAGLDPLKRFGAAIGGLFGPKNPWPRHSDPVGPPADFGSRALPGRFQLQEIWPQKGNQLVLLRFRQSGGGIELGVTFWPLNQDSRFNQPVTKGPITLTAA